MAKQLKYILLKIARLSKPNQRWIIGQLSTAQTRLFNQLQGEQLLQQAGYFRKLKKEIQEPLANDAQASSLYLRLANYSPLYIAIVLEQGQYPWQEPFLTAFDKDGNIRELLRSKVKELKSAVKKVLFKQWETTLSFAERMENGHG